LGWRCMTRQSWQQSASLFLCVKSSPQWGGFGVRTSERIHRWIKTFRTGKNPWRKRK
jgi:hypothetical protein